MSFQNIWKADSYWA